jgi:hypothetical protein
MAIENESPQNDPQPYDRERLLDLADSYLNATATEPEVAALEALLASNADDQCEFLAYSLVHGQLPAAIEASPGQVTVANVFPEVPLPSRRSFVGGMGRLGRVAVVLVALTAAVAAVAWSPRWAAANRKPPLATITDLRFAVTSDPETTLREGQALEADRLAIRSGAMKLALRNGVTIMMSGPADLELIDDMTALLHEGNVVVRVPKGMSGYRLSTATTEVLDLGTEFAVRAGGNLVTDVQVYEGAVIASRTSSAGGRAFPHRVEEGQAVRFAATSEVEPDEIPYTEARFLRSMPPEPARGEVFDAASFDIKSFGTPTHSRIAVMSVDRPIVIDGRLEDWPKGGDFRASFLNDSASPEWVEGRMAYDRDRLYIAARVGDPAPLRNSFDPDLDGDKAWTGGGVQVRISTDRLAGWPVAGNCGGYYWRRGLPELPTKTEKAAATNPQLNHLMMWHHAPSGRACLSITHGMMFRDYVSNPPGYQGAFEPSPDGKGYVLEYAIPWSLLNAADNPPQPRDVLATAWQVHFADTTGQIWRRQIIDIRNLDEPYRIGVWQRAATWGRAEFQ